MGNQYYTNAGADGLWATPANFESSPGAADASGPPVAGDAVIFDAGSTDECVLPAGVVPASGSLASLNVSAAYTAGGASDGHLDALTNAVTAVNVAGNVTFANKKVSMGAATWTFGGDFDWSAVGTLVVGTSTVVFNSGTPTMTCDVAATNLKNVTVNAGVFLTATSAGTQIEIIGTLSIAGTFHVATGKYLYLRNNSNLSIALGGLLSGEDGTLCIHYATDGNGIQLMDGVMTIPSYSMVTSGSPVVAEGEYACPAFQLAGTGDVQFGGDYDFTAGKLTLRANTGNITLSCADGTTVSCDDLEFRDGSPNECRIVNNGTVNWNIGGNTIHTNTPTVIWTKGTGTITLDGDGPQSIDFYDQSVEAIVIASSDTVTLTGGWTATSFSAESGNFDPNGQTLETVGGFAIASGVNLLSSLADADLWDGVALTVGGTFSAIGKAGDDSNLQGDGGWTLDATTAGTVNNVTVSGCDADAGVDITARNSLDGTGNSSWLFQDSGGSGLLLLV